MNKQKLTLFVAICLTLGLCNSVRAQGGRPSYPQNENCVGLKNPSNFEFVGGATNSQWNGFVGGTGCKQGTLSTCTTPGFCTLTPVANASQLESQSSSSCSNSPISYNIDNVQDNSKRFVIKGPGTDPFTGNNLPYLPPDTSFHTSIRLGNYCWNGEVEMLTYQMDIRPENALVTIWYALSLEYAGHPQGQNPEFSIVIEKAVKDATGNFILDANGNKTWTLAGGDTLCYIKEAPTSAQLSSLQPPYHNYQNSNIYRDWNKVMVNLYGLLYETIRIKIAAGDCSPQGHYASCYFAGECQPMALRANGCAAGESSEVARIKAPKGATNYAWYRSKNGVLQSETDRTNDNNYVLISGATDDSLNCNMDQFVRVDNGQTLLQNTFMCKMTTQMNESYPIVSRIYTNVGNTKPTIVVDSLLDCNAGITMTDLSYAPFSPADSNRVDSSATQWQFFTSNPPTEQSLVGTYIGGTAHHTFETGSTANNFYSVKVRTTAYGRSCWNEKTIKIRAISPPTPQITLQRDSLCEGDTIVIYNFTPGAAYTEWTRLGRAGDTLHYVSPTTVSQFNFDTTSLVMLRTRNSTYYQNDTNSDGVLDNVYCYVDTSIVVHVDEYPELVVTGDTIVCNGTQAIVNVASQNPANTYNWYLSMNSNNPLQSNTATLTTTPTHDERYFVKARSPFGCTSWDSIKIYIVDPQLQVPVTEICDNETVRLYASNAYSYTWTSMPDDPSMAGQQENDTLVVTPHTTTTYTLTGHGMNNCSATPLTQTIRVFPYPIPTFEMSPNFIDSEEPVVTFRDVSPNSTSSLWNFGNGNTSTERQIRYTFTDLSEDSILISLTSGNELGCTRDTSFWVPIEIFSVWLPTAFTPDESTNYEFSLFTHNQLEYFSFHLYDRKGNQILYTTDQNFKWDGTYKGNRCPQGVYVYTCTYRRPGTTDIVTNRGTVTLIR